MAESTKKRILNVDDAEVGRYAVTRILTQAGFDVLEASNGRDALRLASDERPDLILLDVNLPDLNGFEVCKRLKADPDTAAIPVIHLSATYVRRQDRVAGLEGGADGYLVQPVDPHELVATITAFLRLKDVEQALRTSEESYRRLVETMGEGLGMLDAQGNLTFGNAAFFAMLGYQKEELLGKPVSELFDTANRRILLEQLKQRREGADAPYQIAWTHKTGKKIHAIVAPQPMVDESGNFVGSSAVITDITERVQSEETYTTIIQTSLDGFWICDTQGKLLEANQALADMLGYTRQELLTLSMSDIEAVETPEETEAHIEEATKQRHNQFESRYRRKDGAVIDVDISSNYLDLEGGRFFVFIRDISERKQAEEALRSSEDRYRDLVEHSQDLICTHDLEGRILSVNPWAANVLGYTTQALLQMNIRDILVPEVRAGFDEYLATLRRDGAASGLMLVQTTMGEERIWAYNNTLRTEGVAAPIVRGMAHDITERKQAEAKIEHLNRVLRAIRNVNQLIVQEKDRVQLIQSAVQLLVESRGYAGALIVLTDERGLPATFAQAGLDEAFQPVGERLQQGQVPPCCEQTRLQTGVYYVADRDSVCAPCALAATCPGHDSMCICLQHDQKEYGFMAVSLPLGLGSDAEEQSLFAEAASDVAFALRSIELEKEAQQSEKALQESETRFRSIYENATVGLYRTTPDGRILMANPALVRLLGYDSFEELVQRNLEEHGYTSETSRAEFIRRIEREGRVTGLESGWLTRDGAVVYVLESATATRDAEGQTLYYEGSVEDITERKQLEAEKEELIARFYQAQKMESIGRLAGGIAHDFNNMLVPIIGYAELGLLQLPPDHELHADLTRIKKSADRAADLTRQILAFSRQQVLEMKVLDLNQIIEEFQTMLQRLIGEDITMHAYLASGLHSIKADKGQLEQVLLNLVVNARDAMPNGGSLTIETANVVLDEEYATTHAEVQPGPYVMLAVSDTGHGMDAATQQHIFEPFFTTKERGEGTGLGLATVFGIVKQHGGHIWVYSEPGRGTTFKTYLPVSEVPVRAGGPDRPKADLLHGTETVLVVEDETGVRELVCYTLRGSGYQVLDAPDPAKGLELAATHEGTIHLLLTDVIMPQMNGRELYEKLVRDRPGLKALYMSGYTDNVIAHQGILEAGMTFLQKPFVIHTLLQKVRMALE
jgi:PAS domain S-box-containing protein